MDNRENYEQRKKEILWNYYSKVKETNTLLRNIVLEKDEALETIWNEYLKNKKDEQREDYNKLQIKP
jgi:hypothetical protein